jgi:hypothetical protein
MHLEDIACPDTVAESGANQVARRYCSSALYAHSVMSPSEDPQEDVEGHLLEVATGIDVSGRGIDLIPTALQREVVTDWPRLDLATEFTECLRLQADRKPTSRAADVTRAGLADALRAHPLERKGRD